LPQDFDKPERETKKEKVEIEKDWRVRVGRRREERIKRKKEKNPLFTT
jgi:hypothetical protein